MYFLDVLYGKVRKNAKIGKFDSLLMQNFVPQKINPTGKLYGPLIISIQ